jgi:hypothetical protein
MNCLEAKRTGLDRLLLHFILQCEHGNMRLSGPGVQCDADRVSVKTQHLLITSRYE